MLSLLLTGILIFNACGGGGGGGAASSSDDSAQTYTLSGTVTAPANAAVDLDVEDPNAPKGSNNSLAAAQPIPSPVSLAGYVNSISDVSDFYYVSISAEQTVTLYIADPLPVDLDLYLYSTGGDALDSSAGAGSIESLEVDEDGDYILEVRICSGISSIYDMIIGQSAGAASGGMKVSDDFVAGEMIIRFKDDDKVLSSMIGAWAEGKASAMGLTFKSGAAGRPVRMKFEGEAQTSKVFSRLGIPDQIHVASFRDPESERKYETLQVIKALRRRDDVVFAEPNYFRKFYAVPDDTYYNLQWHYKQIHLPEAWDITTGSSDVVVAVIDTGVLTGHPDLSPNLTDSGYDFVSNQTYSGDGDGIDSEPDDPGDQSGSGGSSSFHGTHVAGTVAAATNNGLGVAGAGWQTKVMPIRALGIGGRGTDYDIAQAIRYAAGLSNDSGTTPDTAADIINLSLGGASGSNTLETAVAGARAAGVIIIAAAGNEASSLPSYPAAYDAVVSVSAVDYASKLAPYSNYGSTIDVGAPGGDMSADLNGDGYGDGVLSTLGDDSSGSIEMEYGFYQGTSMAAPHVAGVAALMKAVDPGMTPDEFDFYLENGDIVSDIGEDDFGLINAQKAVLAAQDGLSAALLTVSPKSLGFGAALTQSTVTVQTIGGELSVESIADDSAWLSVEAADVDENGLGSYTVRVDRTAVPGSGVYEGTITIESTENSVEVDVTMQVSSDDFSYPDAGYHYILLVDAATGDTVSVEKAEANEGVYEFTFSGIDAGTYRIYAGTDLDADNYIGDAGEVIGAYLSLDKPADIIVTGDRAGLDFSTGFNIGLEEAGTANTWNTDAGIQIFQNKQLAR